MINRTTSSVLAFLVLSAVLVAQEPKTEQPGDSVKELNSWAKQIGKRLHSQNPRIRRSAEAAIVALGSTALPQLRRLADSKDDARSKAAQRLIVRIETNAKRFAELRRRRAQDGEQPRAGARRPGQRRRGKQPGAAQEAQPDAKPEGKPEAKPTENGDASSRRSKRQADSNRPRLGRGTRSQSQGNSKKRIDAVVKRLELDEASAAKLRKAAERYSARQKELASLVREGEMNRDELRIQLAAGLKDFRAELVACLGQESAQKALQALRMGQRGRDSKRGPDARRRRSGGDAPLRRRRDRQKKNNPEPKPAVIL